MAESEGTSYQRMLCGQVELTQKFTHGEVGIWCSDSESKEHFRLFKYMYINMYIYIFSVQNDFTVKTFKSIVVVVTYQLTSCPRTFEEVSLSKVTDENIKHCSF